MVCVCFDLWSASFSCWVLWSVSSVCRVVISLVVLPLVSVVLSLLRCVSVFCASCAFGVRTPGWNTKIVLVAYFVGLCAIGHSCLIVTSGILGCV